jgi:orotate phosphoribosyltransferase
MEKEKALGIFRDSGALLDGHFKLTSGLHSPQYFQCAKVTQYPQYAEMVCNDIAGHYADVNVECVIAPAIGGIIVGQEVARSLGCRSIFAEREDGVMTLRRGFEIRRHERLLAVEDVVTTGGSIKEVIALAKDSGAKVVGVAAIVDRSAGRTKFEGPSYFVLQMDVVTYQPDSCPLCEKGLPLVKPGSRKT